MLEDSFVAPTGQTNDFASASKSFDKYALIFDEDAGPSSVFQPPAVSRLNSSGGSPGSFTPNEMTASSLVGKTSRDLKSESYKSITENTALGTTQITSEPSTIAYTPVLDGVNSPKQIDALRILESGFSTVTFRPGDSKPY